MVARYPQTSHTISIDFRILNWACQVSMAKQAETEEGINHPFGEEDSTDACRYPREGVPNASNDNVFKDARMLHEWRLCLSLRQVPFSNKLIWQLENWRTVSLMLVLPKCTGVYDGLIVKGKK
jgi:hypothetical protein